mmetsp:Transcript_21268/g.68634  ORF Transcript_21268/g.68634 Transcript_21268/m.68634 type:complete len:194 (+) Transcript_21268:2-583(+)
MDPVSARRQRRADVDGGSEMQGVLERRAEVDVARSRFPFAIVWTPIPCLTWLLPFVGHMGIADSQGVIYDFAGPYTIGVDDMAFGKPTRYLELSPDKVRSPEFGVGADGWDRCVAQGSQDYSKRMHNLCCDNCHSHVARCLTYMNYNNSRHWNMFKLGAWLFLFGKFVSPARTLQTFLPSLILLAIVLVLILA